MYNKGIQGINTKEPKEVRLLKKGQLAVLCVLGTYVCIGVIVGGGSWVLELLPSLMWLKMLVLFVIAILVLYVATHCGTWTKAIVRKWGRE